VLRLYQRAVNGLAGGSRGYPAPPMGLSPFEADGVEVPDRMMPRILLEHAIQLQHPVPLTMHGRWGEQRHARGGLFALREVRPGLSPELGHLLADAGEAQPVACTVTASEGAGCLS
jgi:hypothetical protein